MSGWQLTNSATVIDDAHGVVLSEMQGSVKANKAEATRYKYFFIPNHILLPLFIYISNPSSMEILFILHLNQSPTHAHLKCQSFESQDQLNV